MTLLTNGSYDWLNDNVEERVDDENDKGKVDGDEVAEGETGEERGGVHEGRGVVEEGCQGPGQVPDAEEVDANIDPVVVVGGVEHELALQVEIGTGFSVEV